MITAQEAAAQSEANVSSAFGKAFTEAGENIKYAVEQGLRFTMVSRMHDPVAEELADKLEALGYKVTRVSPANGTCIMRVEW